eukprot:CAMPEP_0176094328 /NCGR_PEP_ID=MMETSP0120_2-20121206/47269_1 /TAXON_ID=160619 /ORGANISM="Kryptoperidinium foliaceum, Strain CCMP 1326" /LENGTH=337 /DNA_ID=CAMNT_0017428271 /DNA_START=56 /DNA_END=1069 /DNA_ORIENTATION=-
MASVLRRLLACAAVLPALVREANGRRRAQLHDRITEVARGGLAPSSRRLLSASAFLATVTADESQHVVPDGAFERLDQDGDGRLAKREYLLATMSFLDEQGIANSDMRAHVMNYYRRLFEAADVNGDRFFDEAELEFAELLAETYGLEQVVALAMNDVDQETDFGEESAGAALAHLDEDRDGVLDRAEYAAAVASTSLGWGGEEFMQDPEVMAWMDDVFSKADLDADGVLDSRETQFALLITAGAAQQRMFADKTLAAILLRELDANGDKQIDKDEIRRAVAQQEPRQKGTAHAPSIVEDVLQQFETFDRDRDGALDMREVTALAARIIEAAGQSEP